LAQGGGISSCGKQLGSNNRRRIVVGNFSFSSSRVKIWTAWAGDRATAGKQPERRPRGQDRRPGRSHVAPLLSPLRDWHQCDKSRGLGRSPRSIALHLSPTNSLVFYECAFLYLRCSSTARPPRGRSCSREGSALRIRLSFAQHVPDDGGQLPHHRHSGNAGSPPPFDTFEPIPQSRILAQDLVSHLR
jgi:hypothetical protein